MAWTASRQFASDYLADVCRCELDWMTADELSQAVPPIYSEYLARWVPF